MFFLNLQITCNLYKKQVLIRAITGGTVLLSHVTKFNARTAPHGSLLLYNEGNEIEEVLHLLAVENTPQLTGVLIKGDRDDFENLYEALHEIVGPEEIIKDHYDVRIRVLGLCYDLRHAMMGHRNAFFKPHGLEEEQMAFLSLVGSKQNLYLSFETYWPELLFITFALEDFISLYTKREKAHAWDATIMTVRQFQSIISKLLEETVTPRQFSSLKKMMTPSSLQYKGYFTQFVDIQNMNWFRMSKEQRQKNLSIVAKRFSPDHPEYQLVKEEIEAAAKEHDCSPSEIRYSEEYPDVIDW